MMRSLLLPLALILLVPCAHAEDEAKALTEFRKAFRPAAEGAMGATSKRVAAVRLLEAHDSLKVAKALVAAYEQTTTELERSATRREEGQRELERLREQYPAGAGTALPQAVFDRLQALQRDSGILRAQLEDLERIREALLSKLRRIRDPKGLDWLLAKVIGNKRIPFSIKLSIARAAAPLGEVVVEGLTKALGRARRVEELMVILDGLGNVGPAARSAGASVVKLLGHKVRNVRERAAWALSGIAIPEAIEPLLERLEKESGRTQRMMAFALEEITRQKIGVNVAAWKRWFVNEGPKYLNGEMELGGGESTLLIEASGGGSYYHGIPQDGEAIVYVIDCSGSMVVSIKDPEYAEGRPVEAEDAKDRRIEACKSELSRAIAALPLGTKFNIVAYNDTPRRYLEKMVAADPRSIKAAQAWVAALGASSSTNIHDAMKVAFSFAGRGAQDRYYESEVDTVFLLTDGSPTTPDGKPDSTQKVIEAVRRWNPFKSIRVHCIGVGRGVNVPFLSQLASENGGRFVTK